MAYSVTQLIANAWYVSGLVSRGLQTVSGDQYTDGLYLLNALLNFQTADSGLVPYFNQYNFTAVIGQESYFIPNAIKLELMTFTIAEQQVRYNTIPLGRIDYFGSARANNIQSLPFNWRLERSLGGATLYMYFLPQEAYNMTVWGKFGLTNATATTDLSTLYDLFYIEYLRYELAKAICDEYAIEFQPMQMSRLIKYRQAIYNLSPRDLSIRKMTLFMQGQNFNYAQANLGHGWVAS